MISHTKQRSIVQHNGEVPPAERERILKEIELLRQRRESGDLSVCQVQDRPHSAWHDAPTVSYREEHQCRDPRRSLYRS